MARALALALLLALAAPAVARAATNVAEVRSAQGALVAAATGGVAYTSPKDRGWTLTIGASAASPAGVDLEDVSLLGGWIHATRVTVPAKGTTGAIVDGLTVNGVPISVDSNTIVPLGGQDYLVALQAATLPGTSDTGLVGLRLVAADARLGVPAGTQILVGVDRPARPARLASRTRTSLPFLILGLTSTNAAEAAATPIGGLDLFTASGGLGERAAAIALRYLGIPYRWGGADPLGGFDCSGLTMYVYAQLGVPLTHYTGSQWQEGLHVSRDQLLPGDLVFFDALGHEGMYLGGGRFIQAPHTGDVVKVSSLDDPRYALAYVGAVRPYGP